MKEILFNRIARITDAGLKEVAKLKHLEGLSLMETQITDAGLQELAGRGQCGAIKSNVSHNDSLG